MTRPTKPAFCFCRCGIVEYALHFATSEERIVTHDVALKILKRAELERQHDDPVREVDAMSALRAPGFVGSRRSAEPCERGQQLIPRWRTIMDGGNVYTAAEFASNGSLIQFAHTYLQSIHFEANYEELYGRLIEDIDVSKIKRAVSRVWLRAALSIFAGIASAVAWMHSRRVAHLDLDPYNVVVDSVGNPLIVDFGSAERWRDDDDRAMVGRGRPIPCKRVFAAPELLVHNRTFKTSMGVRGDAADCWALGSMLYWLLCLSTPDQQNDKVIDPVGNDPKWMSHVRAHATHLHPQNCRVCALRLDPAVEQVLMGLLIETEPATRLSASVVADRMQNYREPIVKDVSDLVEQALSDG
ncbi:hypothetical protein PINS_up002754 [Pythium insidiosum]|nr:hypothetical protein PINS_up002754 [Pythium insidiosum]